MTTIVAVPYNVDASSFCFSSAKVFDKKQAEHFCRYGSPVEEYWFDLIDGESAVFEFNSVFSLDQCNLEQWFEYLERYFELSEKQKVAFMWLLDDIVKDIDMAFDKVDSVIVFKGLPLNYVTDYLWETGGHDEWVLRNLDYESITLDWELNKDIQKVGDFVICNPLEF